MDAPVHGDDLPFETGKLIQTLSAELRSHEAVSLPIAIRPEDACPTCEILDNGTSPPPGHSLFYRSFAVTGRQFDLFVEFGTPAPSADQFAHVNDVLATLEINPPEIPPLHQAGDGPEGQGLG